MRCPLLLFLLALTISAQTATFEGASIRPANRTLTGLAVCGRVDVSSDTILSVEGTVSSGVHRLDTLISDAYRDEVDDFDLPGWMANNGALAVSVKIPPGVTARACRKMLQTLLAERFHLATAIEIRDVVRYHLKIAKSGLKLKSAQAPSTDPNAGHRFEVKNSVVTHTFHGSPMSRVLRIVETEAFMDARARSLRDTGSVRDPGYMFASVGGVVDETGLTGSYDGELVFSALASLHDELAESLPDALTRQLGLTLERRKSPGKVLIIRSSDRAPTEN